MKYIIPFVLLFSLSCKANFTMDTYVDEFINIDAKGYYLKILTPESEQQSKDYFFGKIVVSPGCSFVRGSEERVINCYLLDADNYEEWKSGKDPSTSIFKKIEKSDMTIPITELNWDENKKYYFIISNRFSEMNKSVHLYLIRIY
ncbi:MAG TPA: hypothetical protein VF399_12060 [bacterium]